jgi:PucR C-terminal helix-turn-helix domain
VTQLTKLEQTEPWRALPPEVADAIEPALPAVTRAILEAIALEVPEYQRPLEGTFGRGLRVGVDEALRQFVALIRDPDAGREQGRGVYVGLGRGELRQGRTLDSLQSAYRVGARAAWREISGAAEEGGFDAKTVATLAEAIFAYINELSADSVEGFAEAQSELHGEQQRRRRELAALLLRDPPAEDADIRTACQAAAWTLPDIAAALACAERDLEQLARELPAEALVAVSDGTGCALIPDPEGPGRAAEIAAAADRVPAAMGPAGPPSRLARSWSLARSTLGALQGSGAESPGLVRADKRLTETLIFDNPATIELIAAKRLGPLEKLTPKARDRMRETALSYIQQQGNAAAMARSMHVHPQTARYRLARLRELMGEALDDPDARFELELALRA